MANITCKLLPVPSKTRSEEESELLSEIRFDSGLKDPDLRQKVLNYMRDTYALVVWYHLNGPFYSFEEPEIAEATLNSYRKKPPSLPRILGIRRREHYAAD